MSSAAVLPARRPRGARAVRVVPQLVEVLLVAAAMAWLLPLFDALAGLERGRDARFEDPGIGVQGLPDAVLPAVCAAHGMLAEPLLSQRLCGSPLGVVHAGGGAAMPSRLPGPLADALARTAEAFAAPVERARRQIAELRLQQREGIGELRGLSDAIAGLEADAAPLVERFQLAGPDAAHGPAPLHCAAAWTRAALAQPLPAPAASPAAPAGASPDPAAVSPAALARANAVLLLASAVDGHGATEALAHAAVLPAAAPRPAECPGRGDLASALAASGSLMAGARQALANERKNEAMRELLRTAGWQWAGAMALGLVLLQWSRRATRPAFGVAAALALWAAAAWLARVPWPLATRHFEPGRATPDPWSAPAPFVIAMAALALLCFVRGALRAPVAPAAPQAPSSRLGYPGLVVATGLGWLLLLDLSAQAHLGNRYLALYHQGHLWLGMLVLTVAAFLRQPLARATSWALSVAGEAARAARRRLGGVRGAATAAVLTLALLAAFGLALPNMRQLTSELGRVWLIVGAAWFFFLRGGPLAEGLARSGTAARAVLRYVWPLLFVVGVLIAAMALTRDMGPLLIAGYASGAFLGASVAMWWHQRTGRTASAFGFAVLVFSLWIAAITMALFQLGSLDDVTAARLESLAAPLASGNDQLALVSWFQQAAPSRGFGIAAVPWCGYAGAAGCGGVPAQIHSDYTFTALVGAFGTAAAWAASIACAVWLHRLVRHHGRVTRGEPRFVRVGGRLVHDAQAFLSWIAVAWVVLTLCQLAVTVAGNLAVLPLTGVTFPFVSFGMTSLVVNMGFLALALNVDLPDGGADA